MQRMILFEARHSPIPADRVPARIDRHYEVGAYQVGSARVSRIALNHPGTAFGYRIDDADGASLCYLTDNELVPPGPVTTTPAELAIFARATGLLIHDAQYLPEEMPQKRGWGHSVVDQVLELGREAEARTLALYHHDKQPPECLSLRGMGSQGFRLARPGKTFRRSYSRACASVRCVKWRVGASCLLRKDTAASNLRLMVRIKRPVP